MQRRKFLYYAGAAGLALLGGAYLYRHKTSPGQNNFLTGAAGGNERPRAPLLIPGNSGLMGMLDVSATPLTLSARALALSLTPTESTSFLGYAAQYAGKSYQNPTIRIQRGQQFTARLQNALDQPTITHWHGLHVPGVMDGHPRSTVAAGGQYDYTFPVSNRGGLYWYHSHAHQLTAEQVYLGQAGLFMVEDEDDRALRNALQLEPGVTELLLLIQDKQFDTTGKLSYSSNMMQQMMGQLGDTILVNFTPRPQLDIANRLYRFRVLNGSNSRIYKLAFAQRGKNLPYTVIGTDAGLLDRPYVMQEVFLAPAERLDILFDARQLKAGEEVWLKSVAFDPMNREMMGGMGGGGMGRMMSGMGGMGGSSLALGAEFEIMKLWVARQVTSTPAAMPTRLSTIARIDTQHAPVRNISLGLQGMRWVINGESFDMNRYPIQSRSNTVELWDFQNAQASMPHPMHMHGFSFQVVRRANSPGQIRKLAQDPSGRLVTDLGWKDTVLVWPGETVRIAIDFTNRYKGDQIYVVHCHNLEHEDQGMMVNHLVKAA